MFKSLMPLPNILHSKELSVYLLYILPLPRRQRKCDNDDDEKMTTLTPPPPASRLIHSQTSIHFSYMHYFPAFIGLFFIWSLQERWTEVSLYTQHKSIQCNDTEHTMKCWQSAMYILYTA
jgi:hypothetical protein